MDVYERLCGRHADDNFGPVVASCARSFDFTLLFEQAILSLPPNAVFLLLLLWRMLRLHKSSPKTRRNWILFVKIIAALGLTVSQVLLLVFVSEENAIHTRISIPAAVLSLLAAVALGPLSCMEHYRSVRPSTLLNCYLVFSIILDLPQTRTLYLIPGGLRLACIFSAALAVKLAMLMLEAWDKRSFLVESLQNLPSETTSGILSRSLFLWLNSLFKLGYSKVISFEDLGPIDSLLGSAFLHQQLQEEWMRQKGRTERPLLVSLWKALRWSLLSPIPARLCYCGFLFAQPFLIDRATSYLSQQRDPVEHGIGYGLIGATACVYLGIAISTALFRHQLYRHITMVRGSLVSLIYTQSLSLEDQIEDLSAPVTLMSTDVDRICQSLVLLHDLWARPLELILGISLLARQIGWLCMIPAAVVLLSALADSQVTRTIGGRVKVWTTAVQHRISLTADVLSSMKSVKIIGLAGHLSALLQNERLHELRLQTRFRWSTVLLNTFGNVPPAITPAATFLAYAIKAHMAGSSFLNTSQVFTSLALITLVTTPASELLAAFPFVASCLGCLERIQQHLLLPTSHDREGHFTPKIELSEKAMAARESEMMAAHFSDVDILLHDAANPLLHHVNINLPHYTVTIVLGPSGSGKSTLQRALLGEARCRGSVVMGVNRIVYCPQTSWIFTGTVRQNICGLETLDLDESWYRTVLHACVLDGVLSSLPFGDNTWLAGSSSSLSGGQKQRLVLARALYRRPELLLLDDILSALDLKTESQLMARLFGRDGIFSRLKATVVLVTHSRHWVAMADNVITLDGTGSLTQTSNTPSVDLEIFPSELNSRKSGPHPTERNVPNADPAVITIEQDNLSSVDTSRGSETMDYLYYFKSVRWPVVLILLLFAMAQTLCYYMSQVVLEWWTLDGGSDEIKWLPTYVILAIGNAVLYGCMAWCMFLKLVPESAANLHRSLLEVVTTAPYTFFTETDVGVILNRFSQDMSLIESQLPTGIMCTLLYLLWTMGSLALISMGSTWMALFIPVVLTALYLLQRVYLLTARRLRAIELELRSPTYSHFLETLKGRSSIRALQWETQFTNAMMEKLDDSQVPYYLLYCAQRWLQLVLDLIVAALAIVVMTLAVTLRRTTQSASLGLSLSNILSFNEILAVLLQFWSQLEVSLGAIARTREFARKTPTENQPASPASLPREWPSCGQIEMNNVWVHSSKATVILEDISMTIRPGERIGICGRSGSGKSSLLAAILRLLEPTRGSIMIDGINLSCVPHQIIRERLLAVPQEPFLLQHTVRLNLDPGSQRNDGQIIRAVQSVLLWPVLEKKGGLDATVTSDLLSQGQKQLFNLARALLRKEARTKSSHNGDGVGGILLLDEATSNLDMATDTQIQRIIRKEFSTYTILIVAHRLNTILDCDRIAVFDRGRLSEFDRPQVLLSKQSAFSTLSKTRQVDERPDSLN